MNAPPSPAGSAATDDSVLIERIDAGVLTLTMNRPERRNALNPALLSRLHDALQRAATDREVRAIVLTGAGQAFSAGGDVKAMADGAFDATLEERVRSLRERMESARLLHQMPKPTIAVIQGAAAGAGLSLALACDFRLATPDAKITTAFAKVGLSGDFGGSFFLTQLVGSAKARELYLLSPLLTGQQAFEAGLVTRVIPGDRIEAESAAFARELASGPTITLGYIKKNINLAEHASLEAVFDAEALHHSRCSQTDDHREASRAFVEKRAPAFRGA
ncbi:MAG: enoyl-CoA hydratase [Burkholderiaceae bacterium]